MAKWQYNIQAAFWRIVTKPIPTCFLQERLSSREGVTSKAIAFGDEYSISGVGPCILTVNID